LGQASKFSDRFDIISALRAFKNAHSAERQIRSWTHLNRDVVEWHDDVRVGVA